MPKSCRRMVTVLGLSAAALLAGCGQKGPLYLTEEQRAIDELGQPIETQRGDQAYIESGVIGPSRSTTRGDVGTWLPTR